MKPQQLKALPSSAYWIMPGIIIQRKTITIDQIKKICADYFEISVNEIISKSRRSGIIEARKFSMFFSRLHTRLSLEKIGKAHEKDHATVCHAIKTINNMIEVDKDYRIWHEEISEKICNINN